MCSVGMLTPLIWLINSYPLPGSPGSNLIFTLGILAPLLIAIGQGLPVNCLDVESSLLKELKSK